MVPSVCFTPWNGVRIPLTTTPASLPCTPLFVAMRHLPPTGGSLCSLAAVSSAAIPVRVKLKIPRANAAAATTLDIPTGWDLQQRRPRPVADAGRSCWGNGQQTARAAQDTRGCWEPQPGALKKSPVGCCLVRGSQRLGMSNVVAAAAFARGIFNLTRTGNEQHGPAQQGKQSAQWAVA